MIGKEKLRRAKKARGEEPAFTNETERSGQKRELQELLKIKYKIPYKDSNIVIEAWKKIFKLELFKLRIPLSIYGILSFKFRKKDMDLEALQLELKARKNESKTSNRRKQQN